MNQFPSSTDLAHVGAVLGEDLDTMAVYNVLRTATHLGSLVDDAMRDRELTAAALNALLVLRHAGAAGRRMGELGRALVVTKSNVTGLVDRLERRGLVERAAAPDRRATTVRLTRAGRARVDRVVPAHSAAMRDAVAGLTDREKRRLTELLTKLRRHLRGQRRARRGTA
jgi:MarR family 2-MHQ and catechol resistance regulon transcriptional repressor